MAKKNTEITPDMPMDVFLMEVVAPSITKIQDNLHELKKKVESLEDHSLSGLSSSETDDLAENVADKVVSKIRALQVTQSEQKKDDQESAISLLNAAREDVRKEVSPMVHSVGNANTKLDTVISRLDSLKKEFDEHFKTDETEVVSKIQRYSRRVLPAVTALAAFLFSWGVYHDSYHYWGERFHKLTNDPMQTEQPLLDLKYNSFEMIKIEFEGGRKKKAKDTIKKAESRLRRHKNAVKKAARERKKQARKNGGTGHAE